MPSRVEKMREAYEAGWRPGHGRLWFRTVDGGWIEPISPSLYLDLDATPSRPWVALGYGFTWWSPECPEVKCPWEKGTPMRPVQVGDRVRYKGSTVACSGVVTRVDEMGIQWASSDHPDARGVPVLLHHLAVDGCLMHADGARISGTVEG